jgi:hypothetical protein
VVTVAEILRCDNCEREKNRRYASPGTLCECGGAYRVAQSAPVRQNPKFIDVQAAIDAADVAQTAVLEAAFAWCVMNSILTEGEFYGDVAVWDAIETYFPGGRAAFVADLPGSTDMIPLKVRTP